MNQAAEIPSSTTIPELRSAWDHYLATLDELREALETSLPYSMGSQHRGMAYRQLLEVQAMGYNYAVAPRPTHPRMYRNTGWQTEHYSIGGNGPDFDYRTVFLDGAHNYRLTGNFRDSRMLLGQLNSSTPGSPTSRCVNNYDFSDFHIEDDGSFEIIISVDEQSGNWIQMVPDSDYQWMLLRPTAENWDEKPAELFIERISELPADYSDADEYSELEVAKRLGLMTDFVRYLITSWATGYVPIVFAKANSKPNIFINLSVEEASDEGSLSCDYLQCVFQVEDDEALILELDEEPDGPYWSLQLLDLWQHSLSFRTRQTTLNGNQAVKDSDGRIRMVLCRKDPGVANWLDTAGYTMGEIVWRNYKVKKLVDHRIHRVKFSELDNLLPTDTRKVSPEQRAAAIKTRCDTYLERHGE